MSEQEYKLDDKTEEVLDDKILTPEEELRLENAALKEQMLRDRAELENFKKRINDERIRERKYASQGVISNIIDIVENLNKVVNITYDDDKINNFIYGFKMINNQLFSAFEQEGVKAIDSIGMKFDPTIHHAIGTVSDESKEDGIVLEELSKGYMYKDRVLKAAMVKINKISAEDNKEA